MINAYIFRRCLTIFTLFFALTITILPQGLTSAGISGTIAEKDGGVLPAATILATHVPSGTQYATTSRGDGKYNLFGLRVGGPYTLVVSYIGFTTEKLENITLELGQNLQADFILSTAAYQIGDVMVTAERNPLLSSSRTGNATNVSREQIDKLPTISRSFEDYYKLSPIFNGSSAAGRNSKYNHIQIDGSNYNDLFGLGGTTPGSQSRVTPISLDAIEEFQIAVSPFDVRHSGFTGAGINAITRSGTNQYKGSVFYYGRNQGFVGKSPDTLKAAIADFTDYQAGFRAGGPIIENKLFFFLNGEITRYKAPLSRIFGAQNLGSNTFTAVEDSLVQLTNYLKSTYGYDPGPFKNMNFERKSDKIFARLDWNISQDHKLSARWNYLNAADDNTPSRGRGATDIYFDYGRYVIDNVTNSFSLQLKSLLSNNLSNEFTVGYINQLDQPVYKGSAFPTLYIRTANPNATYTGNQTLVLGAEQFRHKNELGQNVIEITNNLTYLYGSHVFTAGLKFDFFKFRNLFIPSGFGVYTFNYISDFLQNKKPAGYEYRYSATANPEQDANWAANQIGFYLQDEWTVLPNLKITGGVRLDIPSYPDKPNYNAKFDTVFAMGLGYDYQTNKMPKTSLDISPRLGFNWAIDEERNTQVRGGIGVFSGRFPAVWVSNQYSNTGVDFYTYTVTPNNFVADINNQPRPASATLPTAEVNVTDPNYKAPSILRTNLAVDQVLPYNFVFSLEGIYSKTYNDVWFENINLKGQQDNSGLTAGGIIKGENREVWGTYNAGTRRFTSVRHSSAFTGVYALKNTDQGSNLNLVFQLQRLNAPDGIYTNIAYTYSKAEDVNSGVSAQARSSWRFNPTSGNPNKPVLSASIYDRTHRFMAAVAYTHKWEFAGMKTTVGLFYNGASGRPFSYYVAGDINGDGESDNDLIYIPKDENDIILVNSSGNVLPTTDAAYASLFDYINSDDYLKENKGKMSVRNGAREPWIHQFDLRISHEIPTIMGQSIELSFDIINLTNLLNSEWGWQKEVTNQNVALVTFHSLDNDVNSANYGKPRYQWTNLKEAALPANLNSRWQAQFGVRYNF